MKGNWCPYRECLFCQEESGCSSCEVYLTKSKQYFNITSPCLQNFEKERIKKSINEYYGRPDVEQGIKGFREAVRYGLEEEE